MILMSTRPRAEIEQAGIEAIRGWQTDQDMFDEAAAAYLGINRTDSRCVDLLDRGGRMTAGQLPTAGRLTSGAATAGPDRLYKAGTGSPREHRHARAAGGGREHPW